MLWQLAFGASPQRTPEAQIAIQQRSGSDFAQHPRSGLRATWLGHSTVLVEIDGQRLLIDPVWGERASPLPWAGPKRFFLPPLGLSELPPIDGVLISHDHYDHLDRHTVVAMLRVETQWFVPLGVGAHLEAWGMPAERIVELDWWQRFELGGLRIICTPSRHFSGRSFGDQNATLWAGWAVQGPNHSLFYSGDTALHEDFRRIGNELGPFDLTLIESGAYSALWPDVHLGPEQAVIAHQLVQGGLLMPVHWGSFNLALHGWTEPVERLLVAAQNAQVRVAVPRPGGSVEPANGSFVDRFWPVLPWQEAAEAPAWSTGVQSLQTQPTL